MRFTQGVNLPTSRPEPNRRPAIRWSVAFLLMELEGHGSGVRCAFVYLLAGASGLGPELFAMVVEGRSKVVETRRLELLTLSLQRRCSAS